MPEYETKPYFEADTQASLSFRTVCDPLPRDLGIGSGAPPGDKSASGFFHDSFDDWLMHTSDEAMWVQVPWEQSDSLDINFSSYADDLARRVMFVP